MRLLKKVKLEDGSWSQYKIEPKDLVYTTYPNILIPKFIIGGDEGCMCMYFKYNDQETYLSALKKHIAQNLELPTGGGLPSNNNTFYTASLKRSDDESKITYDLLVEIIQNDEVTARFWQKGIPQGSVGTKIYSRDDRLKKDFFKNASELLLRNTFIASLISRYLDLSYFPSKEFDSFLSEAIQ